MCKKDVIKILVGSLNQAGMKVADYLKKQVGWGYKGGD